MLLNFFCDVLQPSFNGIPWWLCRSTSHGESLRSELTAVARPSSPCCSHVKDPKIDLSHGKHTFVCLASCHILDEGLFWTGCSHQVEQKNSALYDFCFVLFICTCQQAGDEGVSREELHFMLHATLESAHTILKACRPGSSAVSEGVTLSDSVKR